MYRGVLKVGAIAGAVILLVGLGAARLVRLRETSNTARCKWHLHEVGLKAMWTYADPAFMGANGSAVAEKLSKLLDDRNPDDKLVFPPGTLANSALAPDERLSWQVILLSHLGHDDVRRRFDDSAGWKADANRDAVTTLVREYACPSQYQKVAHGQPPVTHFVGVSGLGADAPRLAVTDPRAGFLRYVDPTKGNGFQRGLSNTLAILEVGMDHGPWAAGGPATVRGVDPANRPHVGRGRPFGGHPKGANACFADGSVRFQADSINSRVLEMLTTLRESTIDE